MTRNRWVAVGAIIGVLFVTLACESTTLTPGAPTPTPGAGRRGLLALALVCLLGGVGINGLAMLRDPVDTLVRVVGGGEVAYDDTLYSLEHAFPVLQARYILRGWEWRDLDIVLAR